LVQHRTGGENAGIKIVVAFLALLSISAAAPTEPYLASGQGWTLRIAEGRVTYAPEGGPQLSFATPPLSRDETGWSFEAPELSFQAFIGGCEDEASGRRYTQSVWLQIGKTEIQGCGGEALPEGSVVHTSWMIREISGTPVRGASWTLDFHADSFLAYTGCNRIEGGLSQRGDTLLLVPRAGTVRRCSEPVGGCERALLRVLTKPVKLRFADRRTLVLSGEAGSVTLYDPGEDEDIFASRVVPCPASQPAATK
jgi:heat shock protein HslJ/uncharacterized membrane protein